MYFSREWLDNKLTTLSSEEEKLTLQVAFVNSASDFLVEECKEICASLNARAEREDNKALKAFVLVHKAYVRIPTDTLKHYTQNINEAEKLATEAGPSSISGLVLQMCAFHHWGTGNRDKAFELSYLAIKWIDKAFGEVYGWTTYQQAVFHFDLKDYQAALNFYHESEKFALQTKAVYQLARIASGKASIAFHQNNINEALELNEKALAGYRECGHLTAISRALNDLGVIYFKLGQNQRAKEYLSEASRIRKELNYWLGLTTTEIELGRIHLAEQSFQEAENILNSALRKCDSIGARQKVITCHMLLAEVHKAKNEFRFALEHLERGYAIQSELTGEEASNRIKHLQQKHATEQADHEAEIHRLKNVELKAAYDAIEDQNKSILDSITYAKRIQTALLGSRSLMKKHLSENFILYKPKDIVSGDFWWCAEERDKFYFAVADCTGHGVPGAFMSLLNINMLNRSLNENPDSSPANILDEVRKHVVASLNPEGQEMSRDGMDVVVCALNKSTGILEFACANNAMIHVRDNKLAVHGPDKFHVGLGHNGETQAFTNYVIQLMKNDCVYLSTDGFADQFGGEKGKKFKQKRLRELLLQNSSSAISDQENLIEQTFESWRGNLEQVDDVLILGFRYSQPKYSEG